MRLAGVCRALNWYLRREIAITAALTLDGWGCVRLPGERHIGRVIIGRKHGHAAGFYPITHHKAGEIERDFAAAQKARTTALPK